MKKLTIISFVAAAAFTITACSDVKREPGRVYMPDMAYSRAYETYSVTEERKAELLKQGIHYSNMPVPGTVKRGENYTFRIPKDAQGGDSTNYHNSREVQNPLDSLDAGMKVEANRLYLINCGICHGTALDGNGPLYKGGEGPFIAKPRALVNDPITTNMPEGQMFYSVTYGKGAMGSYASQLNATQRWMIIKFIKMKQAEGAGGATGGGSTTPTKDSTGAANSTTVPPNSDAGAKKPAGK